MKKKNSTSLVNIALSSLSVLLIVLGLYFIFLGVKDVVTNTDNTVLSTDNGDINDGISVTKTPDEQVDQNDALPGLAKSLNNQKKMREVGKWIATDYVKGDIAKGQYIVKSGDTLWEIAEAVYGSGFEWKKILEKNKSSIGFLPNGSQALIIPGQVLVIP